MDANWSPPPYEQGDTSYFTNCISHTLLQIDLEREDLGGEYAVGEEREESIEL